MQVNMVKAIKLLIKGEVIGVPTDTVYGLAVKAQYIDKLYQVKRRDRNKKIVKLIPDMSYIVGADEELKAQMQEQWPGKTTYVYEVNKTLESFRIPNEPNILRLLREMDSYLYVSSANISGEPPCITSAEFEERFPNIPLLEEIESSEKDNKPSHVIIYKDKKFERIR